MNGAPPAVRGRAYAAESAHPNEATLDMRLSRYGNEMNPNGPGHALNVPFESICPKCTQVRPQRGFDRNALLRLLSRGYPVEAHCALCDEFWSISAKERAALVAAAIAGGGSFVC